MTDKTKKMKTEGKREKEKNGRQEG